MSSSPPAVTGAIPRVERQQSHHEFLWAVRPPLAMVDLVHGARIAASDDPFFPPETHPILTTTIADSTLSRYTFTDELQILAALQPTYVIPCDLPIYGDMSPSTRRENLQRIRQGTRRLHHLSTSTPQSPPTQQYTPPADTTAVDADIQNALSTVTVLPLVKGRNPLERDILLELTHTVSPPCLCKYGVQYITAGGPDNYPTLVTHLEQIATESDNYPLLVIGVSSPSGMFSLEGLPSSVTAAAGLNQWVTRVSPNTASPAEMRDSFTTFSTAVAETLSVSPQYDPAHARTTPDTPPQPLTRNPGSSLPDFLSPTGPHSR